MPWRLAGRFSSVLGDWEEGKTVERVPRGVRWRMRRARIADSYEVGILKLEEEEEEEEQDGGLEKMCCGGPVLGVGMIVAATRGKMVVKKGKCILYGC
jgi:hypothetical protein